MAGKVITIEEVISPERLACQIADTWVTWDNMRQRKKDDWDELRRYVYATDTLWTTNNQNPWKNKTTIPKLCQIMDNLYANYTATMFPQRKWLIWEANEKNADSTEKRDSIQNYMSWVIEQPEFKHEFDKIVLDYIQFGNCFVTVEWKDRRVQLLDKTQVGYVGPAVRRISPLDIVMNPAAPDFISSPKVVRSLIGMGECKKLLQQMSNDENREEYEELWSYLRKIRAQASELEGEWYSDDTLYEMDGFTSFREYLRSDTVEILTFYGDLYDPENDEFYENHVITVVDRHKIIGKKPNPSFFGYPPIYHTPWRKRQDNLWGMGPLDNIVGMQYRMDHVENLKADVFDLVTYPVQKVKGFVDEYIWRPGEKIFCGDEGDVTIEAPDVNALQANFEIDNYERRMEEISGSPREAMGFRTPGEKTKYEVQRLENAAARIFQNKIKQFEESIVEPILNAMLELAKRNMANATTIKIFDDELKTVTFETLTVEDITGIGRIRPVAARHFAEQAQLVQDLTNLSQSNLWPLVQMHFSGIKMAQMFEQMFNIGDYQMVLPYINLAEQADAQRQVQALTEQVAMESTTATGMGEDFDVIPMPEQPISPEETTP